MRQAMSQLETAHTSDAVPPAFIACPCRHRQVSAGYDAHWRDPLAGLQVRTSTYHHLVEELRNLADRLASGRLVCLLEGGYDLKVRFI